MARDKDRTRARLFEEAVRLFADRGYHETTVDDIAESAGVAKGTVYYHFKSKADLVEALITEGLGPLASEMRAAAETPGTTRDRLAELVRVELAFFHDNRLFARFVVTEMWRDDRVWRDTLVLLRREIVAPIMRVVSEGVSGGELRGDLDAAFAASGLFSVTATAALDWLAFDPERDLESVAGQILRLASMVSEQAQA